MDEALNEEIQKSYFSISEVAEQLELTTSLIRFWESEFDILQPRKNRKGNRIYSLEDIRILKEIKHLVKDKGFTLKGAREKLKMERKAVTGATEIRETLHKVRAFLVNLRDQLPE